jgi:hypothetical protein
MAGPSWLAGTVAVVMVATAVYCVSRLAAAWRWQRPTEYDADGVHVLMGVAMAGMLVPRLNPLAGTGWTAGGAVVFGAAVAWFGGRAVRAYLRYQGHQAGRQAVVHHGQHLLASGAMLYMFLALSAGRAEPAGPGMSAAGSAAAARLPTLALVLAVALVGYVIWTTDRLTSLAPVAVAAGGSRPAARGGQPAAGGSQPAAGGSQPAVTPPPAIPAAMSVRLAACCEIVMGVAMGYMLITML